MAAYGYGGHPTMSVTITPTGASDGREELESDLRFQLSSLRSRVKVSALENQNLSSQFLLRNNFNLLCCVLLFFFW
jgi:hypothetical protein